MSRGSSNSGEQLVNHYETNNKESWDSWLKFSYIFDKLISKVWCRTKGDLKRSMFFNNI